MQSPTQIQSPTQTGPAAAQRHWYIQVAPQNYGPFDDATLWAFMCEGRVIAQSLISQYPDTGYHAVSTNPGLMNWLSQVPLNTAQQAPQVQAQPLVQPQAAAASPAVPSTTAAQTVFMVMAEIRSNGGMNFLQILQGLGDVERIGDTVWILQSRASSEDIRNVLCQPLNTDDRLFVIDSYANDTAWYNLGGEMENRVRSLWNVSR